jgi:hypothetical protein
MPLTLLFAALAGLIAGWEWSLVAALYGLLCWRVRVGWRFSIPAALVSVLSSIAFRSTQDRELYFVFCLPLAAQTLGLPRLPRYGGAILISAAFFAMRIAQDASASVLAVEAAMAFLLIAFADFILRRESPATLRTRLIVAAIVSLGAFASLVVN